MRIIDRSPAYPSSFPSSGIGRAGRVFNAMRCDRSVEYQCLETRLESHGHHVSTDTAAGILILSGRVGADDVPVPAHRRTALGAPNVDESLGDS